MQLQCARCSMARRDTALQSFFLCDRCADLLKTNAFNNIAPSFKNFEIETYCGLCNERTVSHLMQWYLCPFCDRLANSYRLGRISQSFALTEWTRLVQPIVPDIKIEVVDQVELSPYTRKAGKKRKLATQLDLRAHQGETPIFWIELKTGQRSIDEFATFQLDVSDCDDILSVVKLTRIPAYVLHIQLEKQYHPPSDHIVGKGIWWSDIFSMTDVFVKAERRQRDGGKMAAHFSPECFLPFETFGEALKSNHHIIMRKRLDAEGPPRMYVLNP